MSDCFDHEAEAWDSLNDDRGDDTPRYRSGYWGGQHDPNCKPKKAKKVTCTFCGKRKLRWKWLLATGTWRLITKKGKQHVCSEYIAKQRKKRLKFRGVKSCKK